MEIKDILEQIALPARSNKNGWKETAKLDKIKDLLKDTGYMPVYESSHTLVFGKKAINKDTDVILVSSHADIVDNIKNPYSELDEETHYYKGTYDNLGTNAAAVKIMLSGNCQENVYFAFNDEEETGRCLGAGDILSHIRKICDREPVIFALDVTDEGYDDNRLFTVEGLHAGNEYIRKHMIEKILSTEGEEQSFEIVRLKKKDDVSFLPKAYVSDSLTVFDESVFYAKQGCTSCSICLPGEGNMHSDSGFYVKESVMEGYVLSLESIIHTFSDKEKNSDRINEIKKEKDLCVQKAKETPFKKMTYYTTGGYYSTGYSYGDDYGKDRERYPDLTDEEYEDMRSWNASFGVYGEDYYDQEYDSDMWDAFMENMFAEGYEICQSYGSDEKDVFYSDMCQMYGVEDCKEMRDMIDQIWRDVKEYGHEDEEDLDY